MRRCPAPANLRQLAFVSAVVLLKTTEVMVVLTAEYGVTRQQIIAVIPSEIRETGSSISTGKSAGGIRGAMVKAPSS
jgi:hypothetical protein